MATTDFIAAIQLGSAHISAMAGRKTSDGGVEVLAHARAEASSFIHKGVVFNIDKAAAALNVVIAQLEEQLHAEVAQVYVGIGGQSLHGLKNMVDRNVSEDENTVSLALVDALCDENRCTPLADLTILDVVPQEYKVDRTLQVDPVGVTGRHVVGQYLNLVANTTLKKNVDLAFDQAQLKVADDLLVSALVAAKAVITPTEMRQGCAFVDIGADTTTLSIYKNSLLRHFVVLPIGGHNITRDLTSLKIEEEEAENLKCQYGDAAYDELTADKEASCLTSGGQAILLVELNNIISARAEEILANVWNQISMSGFENQLYAGTIFMGGGAQLKGLEEAYRKLTKSERVKVAKKPVFTVEGNLPQGVNDGSWTGVIALIFAGQENCRRPEKEQPAVQKPTANQPAHGTISSATSNEAQDMNLFSDDEEWKRQEEQLRIRQEMERKQREAEAAKAAKEQAEREAGHTANGETKSGAKHNGKKGGNQGKKRGFGFGGFFSDLAENFLTGRENDDAFDDSETKK